MRKTKTVEVLVIVFLGLSVIPIMIYPVRAPGSPSNYPETDYATNFGSNGGTGPLGLGFDHSGNLYVGDFATNNVYKCPPGGGCIASAQTELSSSTALGGHHPHGLAVSPDGKLYLNLADAAEVVQLDTHTGAIIRVVATGLGWASGLAIDPLSGDLFVTQSGLGNSILRISNFANGPGTVTLYATVPLADGIAFQSNGTLYVASGPAGGVVKISGTNLPPPTPSTWTVIANVPSEDGLAVSQKPGHNLTIFDNRNDGIITQVTFGRPPGITNVFTGGTRGDFETVGRDGCLYATQTDRIIRVANPNGGCPLGGFYSLSENPVSCVARCSSQPRTATAGSDVFAVWLNNTARNANVLFDNSTNSGTSFGQTVAITTPSTGNAANPQIVAVGTDIYIVWQQNVSLTSIHVFLRASINSGSSFGSIIDLTSGVSGLGPGVSKFPEVAAVGNSVYVVWLGCTDANCDTVGGNLVKIPFKASTDNGSTFSTAVILSPTAYTSATPQIAAMSSNVYLTWSDVFSGRSRTVFTVSPDGGSNFGPVLNMGPTPSGETDLYQSISVTGSGVYLAWTNETLSTANTMFAASTNNGASFGTAQNLNQGIVTDLHPQLAASGSNVNLVWSDTNGGNTEVLYQSSANNGAIFGTLRNLSNVPGISNEQTITASANNVYITWIESNTPNDGVYFVSSSDSGTTLGTPVNLISDSLSSNPVVAGSGTLAFVAWADGTTGNGDIYLLSGQPFVFDFSMSNSGTTSVTQGGTGLNNINLALTTGAAQTVTLSCSGGLPSGALCGFNPISGTPGFASPLTLVTQSSTPAGSYTITVTATAGDLGFSETRSTQFMLTVKQTMTNVGGVMIPVDKLALLAPYIGFLSIIVGAILLTIAYLKRTMRKNPNDQET